MKKSIDSYHSNKTDKSRAFFVDPNGQIKRQELRDDRRYFGMELEIELDSRISLSSDGDTCPHCSGDGEIDCPACHGQPHECAHCQGFGFTGDGVPCDHCARTGVVECPMCHGTHTIVCSHCGGTGHLASDEHSVFDVPAPWHEAVVYESDGSLNHGFEVITEPMTYNAMVEYLSSDYVKKLMDYNQANSSNGVHIHVSRVSDAHTKSVQMIVARLSRTLASMTRSSRYARWYHDVISPSSLKTIEADMPAFFEGNHTFLFYRFLNNDSNVEWADDIRRSLRDRYMCLNMNNSNTLEFRFFNSTKDNTRLIKYLNVVNSIMALADEGKPLAWYACADYTVNADWMFDATASTKTFTVVNTTPPSISATYHLVGRSRRDIINAIVNRSQILGAYATGDTVGFDTPALIDYNLGDTNQDTMRDIANAKYGTIVRFHRRGQGATVGCPLNSSPDYYLIDLYNASGDIIASRSIPSYLIAGRVNVVGPRVTRYTVSC